MYKKTEIPNEKQYRAYELSYQLQRIELGEYYSRYDETSIR